MRSNLVPIALIRCLTVLHIILSFKNNGKWLANMHIHRIHKKNVEWNRNIMFIFISVHACKRTRRLMDR